MQIQNSSVSLSASVGSLESKSVNESLTAWVGKNTAQPAASGDRLVLSPQAQSAAAQGTDTTPNTDDATSLNPKLWMLKLVVESITGKAIRILHSGELQGKTSSTPAVPSSASTSPSQPVSQGWGVNYQSDETDTNTQTLHVTAQGTVNTADGRTIAFSAQLAMSSASVTEQHISYRAGDAAIDPLVINYAGKAADLSDTHFAFDLNADGKVEQIAELVPGSGYLALDKNGDGRVNNGNELFGTQSGNGFTDLAQYDKDGNGWIDANDSVFNRLAVWSKNADGGDSLTPLSALGIGALYLKSADGSIDLNGTQNTQLGTVERTGVYLTEAGAVGTLQQIDLVV